MGLGNSVKMYGYDDTNIPDDAGGGGGEAIGSVSCSICLETVTDNGDRSWAKLQCGHQFHLDCIGSAFNAKGVMQCPNCRKIEKGQWLYVNGSRSVPEPSMEDWVHDEDLYGLSFSEMSFGVHWCPFASLAQLPSFEDGEFSSSSYHDPLGQHGFFTEPTPASSAAHSCPYITYFGPIHPSSSNSLASVSDNSDFHNHWNREIHTPYGFSAIDPHYHNWEYHSSPFSTSGSRMGSSANQQTFPPIAPRSSRSNSDIPTPFMHPFPFGNSARTGNSVTSTSRISPYQGSNARNRDRVQALQAYYQQTQPQPQPQPHPQPQPQPQQSSLPSVSRPPTIPSSLRRSNRGINSHVGSVASSSDQTSELTWFNVWERDHRLHQPFSVNQMERDTVWGTLHQDGTNGSGNIRQRHGSQSR